MLKFLGNLAIGFGVIATLVYAWGISRNQDYQGNGGGYSGRDESGVATRDASGFFQDEAFAKGGCNGNGREVSYQWLEEHRDIIRMDMRDEAHVRSARTFNVTGIDSGLVDVFQDTISEETYKYCAGVSDQKNMLSRIDEGHDLITSYDPS